MTFSFLLYTSTYAYVPSHFDSLQIALQYSPGVHMTPTVPVPKPSHHHIPPLTVPQYLTYPSKHTATKYAQ
jgi:hypothetical protein